MSSLLHPSTRPIGSLRQVPAGAMRPLLFPSARAPAGSMRALPLPLACALALCWGLGCTGGSRSLAKLGQDNQRMRGEIAVATESARVGQAYASQLLGRPGAPALTLLYTVQDVEQMAQAVLPYKMPARDFNAQLTGEVHVERITHVQLHPGNRLTLQVHFRGVDLGFKGQVPAPYRQQVRTFIAAVQSGVVTDVEVQLTTSGTLVLARGQARGSQFNQHRDADHEARLTQELNQRVLRRALPIDATIAGSAQQVDGVTTTATHVAVIYR